MKCKTCGAMNCMAHGGMADDMDMDHMRSLPKPMKMAKGGRAEDTGKMSGKSGLIRTDTEANQNSKGVNRHGNNGSSGGRSEAGDELRNDSTFRRNGIDNAKSIHRETLAESRSMPGPKLKGLAEGGMAEDGMDMDDDHDMDNELHESLAHELMEAFEKKDKKGVLESIKALVMSCGGKV